MAGQREHEGGHKGSNITWDDVELLIVGAGTMGSSLGQAYAQSGFAVGLLDISDDILERAKATISGELEDAQKAGIFSASQVDGIEKRILTTTSYEEACQGKNLKLVIETATEKIGIKKQIFQKLDELCSPQVVLATNSSSLDVNILAKQTKRPDKVVWMHYFYLPHKNRAGEYAGSDTASGESLQIAARYMKLAGKLATPILSSRKGGAADVIFVALLLEAARMVEEGFDVPTVEEAGRAAFNMPLGFLTLMDVTGIPIGIYTMYSFSDPSQPEDPLYKVYGNFFSPSENCRTILKEYEETEDKSAVRWVSEADAKKKAGDPARVTQLQNRFLAVAFVTAVECVEAGVVGMGELDRLCQNAFLWREGPFALMNKRGVVEVKRIVEERAALSKKQGLDFPVPGMLSSQAEKNTPWPLDESPIFISLEGEGKIARIMISSPQTANALDDRVFEDLKLAFESADNAKDVAVLVFDSAPIKTFIAGANVPDFIKNLDEGNLAGMRDRTAKWQDILFHRMTGGGKPKIAIVDGTTFGGGVEVALAFAADPGSVVVVTDRTSFTFPETRLGIYPGLAGTLILPRLIYEATGDAELAVAMSRYYILAGGTATSSPRLIRYLGLADVLVPARKRDETAQIIARAIIANGGKPLGPDKLASLGIQELPLELTFAEKEELRLVKDLFVRKDLIPTLYGYGRGLSEVFFSGDDKAWAERIARRVANNSPHAVFVSDLLINRGFAGFLQGKSFEELAKWELDYYFIPVFEHPDAREGLTALVERRFPEFNRLYPF